MRPPPNVPLRPHRATSIVQRAGVVVATAWLAACGGGETASAPTAEPQAASEATTGSTPNALAPAEGTSTPDRQALATSAPRNEAVRAAVRARRGAHRWKGITAMSLAPDGSALAAVDAAGQVRVIDPATVRPRLLLAGSSGIPATGVAFSPDGRRMMSVGRDSVASIWDLNARQRSLRLQVHEAALRSIAASADGRYVATAGEETRVALWNAATGKLQRLLAGHTDFVNALAFSPDGRLL